MAEKKNQAEAAQSKPKAVKKTPEAKAAPAVKTAAAKATPVQKSPEKSGKTVTITQTASPIGRQGSQRATLIGLGLNKLRRTRTLEDTPSVQGMIRKVKHLLEIKE